VGQGIAELHLQQKRLFFCGLLHGVLHPEGLEGTARTPALETSLEQSPGHAARSTLVRRIWLTVGGLAIAIAFLDPRAWPLAWFGLVPLFAFAPHARSIRVAGIDGWIVGIVANGTACVWLTQTIEDFGGFPFSVSLFFFSCLIAYTGLPFAALGAALRYVGPHAPILLAPALWVGAEFLFPNFFPWRLAHSQRELLWMIQIGDLTGPYGLSFVMAWYASALSRVRRRPQTLIPPLAAALALGAYGAWRLPAVDALTAAAPRAAIGIVQGNLSLIEKNAGDRLHANVERYRELSHTLQPAPDLLIWPETVVGWSIPQALVAPERFDPFPDAPAPLLFGALSHTMRENDEPEFYNSAFLRTARGTLEGRYDKIVLMPFGEFLPFASVFPWIKEISPNSGDLEAGDRAHVLEVDPDLRVAPLICYDDMVSNYARQATRDGATLLVTLANDAWFGRSAALRLHESLSMWRAIENRRFLVRATNTGLTSVIDPSGRPTMAMPIWTATARQAQVRLPTFVSPYTRFGDLFGWTATLLGLILLLRYRPRRLPSH
jgi:apolipoprotein N-acyltransferase